MTIEKKITRSKLASKVWEAIATKNHSFAHVVSPADMSTFILYIFEEIERQVLAGHALEFRNFGTFKKVTRKARVGRNPRDPKEDIRLPAKNIMVFKSSKMINRKFNQVV